MISDRIPDITEYVQKNYGRVTTAALNQKEDDVKTIIFDPK